MKKIKIYEEFIYNELEHKFNKYKTDWIKQTCYHSNPEIVYNNENYKNIISLGNKVIPFLIKDLNENNGDWIFALSSILGVDPVKDSSKGNWINMKKDWLKYIEENDIK